MQATLATVIEDEPLWRESIAETMLTSFEHFVIRPDSNNATLIHGATRNAIMAAHYDDLDTEELSHDLHGTEVGQTNAFICDYCDSKIPIDEPVLYEAVQIGELPNLKAVVNTPPGWGLDVARCPPCDIDTIAPATDGFDEVLVMLTINVVEWCAQRRCFTANGRRVLA